MANADRSPEDLSEGEGASPADPLHAEAPDQGAACLPHHVESTGYPGHGRPPGQIHGNQGVDGEGSDEPGRAEALRQEQDPRDLPSDACVVLQLSALVGEDAMTGDVVDKPDLRLSP